MRVEGSHELPVTRERAWSLLTDPAVLTRCLPGCVGLTPQGGNVYRASIRITHSAAKGSYPGNVRLEELDPPQSYRLVVEGGAAVGFLRASSNVSLTDAGSCTGLRYSGESRVGGPIAFFAGSVLRRSLDALIHDFFDAMAQEIRASATA